MFIYLFIVLLCIVQESCFNQLRTKEQLGYVVKCSKLSIFPTIGMTVLIQSSKPANYLELRIEHFFKDFYLNLEKMVESEFELNKKSLITIFKFTLIRQRNQLIIL